MNCYRPNDLAAYVEGRTSPSETGRIEAHIRECPRCLEAVAAALSSLSADSSPDESQVPNFMDEVFSASRSPKLAMAISRDGIRFDERLKTKPEFESAFGPRFSVSRLLRRPVLPNTSIRMEFDSGALASCELLPGPTGLNLRLSQRPEEAFDEIEVHSSGAILRNAYRDDNRVFVFDRLPSGKTLFFRNAITGESHFVLQTYAVQFDGRDYAKLGIYLASQGLLDEAADIFENHNPAGEFGRRLARVYRSLRYCNVLYPSEVALIRKRKGSQRKRNADTAQPLPVFARLARRLAGGDERLKSEESIAEGIACGLQGRWEGAAAVLSRVERKPKDAELIAALGWSLLLTDKFPQAISCFKDCLLTNPDQVDALTGLEYVQHKLVGKKKEATTEGILTGFLSNASDLIEDEEKQEDE